MTEWVEVLKAKGQSKDKISELESLIENVRNAKDELQQRNNLVLLRQAAHNAGMLNASQKTLIEIRDFVEDKKHFGRNARYRPRSSYERLR